MLASHVATPFSFPVRAAVPLCVFIAWIWIGCKESKDSSPDNRLLVPIGLDPMAINPLLLTQEAELGPISLVWESLNRTDPVTHELQAGVVGLPRVADSTTYIYRLDTSVRFSDSRKVTSEDLLFSLKAVMNPALLNAAELRSAIGHIDTAYFIHATNELAIHLAEPYALAANSLGSVPVLQKRRLDPSNVTDSYSWSDLRRGVISPSMSKWADWFSSPPVASNLSLQCGTGPYRFVAWGRGEQLVLERNSNYWRGRDSLAPSAPKRIIFRVLTDQVASRVEFTRGRLDVLPVSAKTLQDYFNEATPTYARDTVVTNSVGFIVWNTQSLPLSDRRVRLALAKLVDRRGLMHALTNGVGTPAFGPIPPFLPGGDFEDSLPFDPEGARQLLQQAGWFDHDGDGVLDTTIKGRSIPLRLRFILPAGQPSKSKIALVLSEEFRRQHISTEIVAYDLPLFRQVLREGNFDAAITGISGDFREQDLFELWHSSQISQGLNWSRYSNHTIDSLLIAFRRQYSASQRHKITNRIQELLLADQPATYLWFSPTFLVRSLRYDNAHSYQDELPYRYQEWHHRNEPISDDQDAH